MTNDQLVQYAKRRLMVGNDAPAFAQSEIDLYSMIPAALGVLSEIVMRDDARRHLLQQDYSVSLTNGVGDLQATNGSITGNAGEVLSEGVYLGTVYDADNNRLEPIRDYRLFESPLSTVFGYYCLVNKKIYARAVGQSFQKGSMIGAPSPLTVTASYAPTDAADLPAEITDEAINALVALAMQKLRQDETD